MHRHLNNGIQVFASFAGSSSAIECSLKQLKNLECLNHANNIGETKKSIPNSLYAIHHHHRHSQPHCHITTLLRHHSYIISFSETAEVLFLILTLFLLPPFLSFPFLISFSILCPTCYFGESNSLSKRICTVVKEDVNLQVC